MANLYLRQWKFANGICEELKVRGARDDVRALALKLRKKLADAAEEERELA